TAPEPAPPGPGPAPASGGKLRAGALGLVGVLFMAVANAAPITAMTGNVPIAIGSGNGLGAPAGFLVATVVLTLFTVGFRAVALLGYFDISVAAVVLGVFLVAEVVLLAVLAFSVLVKGGGPDGIVWSSLNPVNAFRGLPEGGGMGLQGVAAGSAAIGLFFAFWSWVGFETTAVYGEESRNPRRIVPRATLIAVIGLGLFYTFVSWMVISGDGARATLEYGPKAYGV